VTMPLPNLFLNPCPTSPFLSIFGINMI
jgi:hypothetical protein